MKKHFKYSYLTTLLILVFVMSLSCKSKTTADVAMSSRDRAILTEFLQEATESGLNQKTSGLRIRAIASSFLGSPYIAGSLEAEGEERLQINLRAFDCLTLVETVLALNEAIMQTNCLDSFPAVFSRALQNLRYRNGQIQGYTSRLHYTSEWLLNGQEKGAFIILSDLFAGEAFPLELNYMSTHPDNYPALRDNSVLTEEMAAIETRLNKAKLSYIPKTRLAEYIEDIPEGSIIAISTNLDGLDIAHIGFAYWQKGSLHLLHASSSNSVVEISEKDLLSYLNGIKHFTGIMIAQVNN